MGNGEVNAPTKTQKSTSTQEPPPSSPAVAYPDWTSFQAYYNAAGTTPMPPPGFLHSPVASSPQGHPYMWGPQMLPPYGTPSPYVAMYPHGGLYLHPSIPPGSYNPYATPPVKGTAEASVIQKGIRRGPSSTTQRMLQLRTSMADISSRNQAN